MTYVFFHIHGMTISSTLDTVLERIQNAGLTVKPKKCSVGRSRVEYLGHVICSGTIQPKDDKIQAVKEFPRPLTKTNVRAFFGLSGLLPATHF